VDRGVVLTPAGRVTVEALELEPPGEGEALIRIEASGVCHTDLHIVRTGGWRQVPPIVLGHEGAGVVEAVGEGVQHVGVGERVVVGWRAPICAGRLPGRESGCGSRTAP
jgi:Zn-dependent alcohol dehydrogenase